MTQLEFAMEYECTVYTDVCTTALTTVWYSAIYMLYTEGTGVTAPVSPAPGHTTSVLFRARHSARTRDSETVVTSPCGRGT